MRAPWIAAAVLVLGAAGYLIAAVTGAGKPEAPSPAPDGGGREGRDAFRETEELLLAVSGFQGAVARGDAAALISYFDQAAIREGGSGPQAGEQRLHAASDLLEEAIARMGPVEIDTDGVPARARGEDGATVLFHEADLGRDGPSLEVRFERRARRWLLTPSAIDAFGAWSEAVAALRLAPESDPDPDPDSGSDPNPDSDD